MNVPTETVLCTRGLVKQFTGTLAVDHVDFDVRRGEVHALLGENGAGKSTLIKVLAGVYTPDSGDITFNGKRVSGSFDQLPISFIHQDLGLIETMTVAENIALVGGYPQSRGLISWRQTSEVAVEALGAIGSDIDPLAEVSSLTSAEHSLVAIARALARRSDLLVLDEPTASLPQVDVERLFDAIRRLRARGVGMIYVTHRLDEVFRIADRVTVLRDGKKVATCAVRETTPTDLVFKIVGRPLSEVFTALPLPSERTVLALDEVTIGRVGPVSLNVAAGEIVGLVGLRGAGQDLVGRAIFGVTPLSSGTIRLDGTDARSRDPGQAMRRGIGFVSSKRGEESLAGSLTIRENVFLNPVGTAQALLRPIGRRAERRHATRVLDRFTVRPRDPERLITMLSGGNQQKVVLARWLERGSRILVLEEPTAGVDVGAKAEIYTILRDVLKAGAAVLLISSDFEEVAGISHRALVFNRGRVVAELSRDKLSIVRLTELASGATAVVTGGTI